MKKVTDAQFQELLVEIQGTCQSLNDACETLGFEEDDLTMEQLEELDQNYILCPSCGWWVEAYEMVNEDYCRNCYEDEEE